MNTSLIIRFRDRVKSEMVSIKTHGDRTLYFDFFPLDIGKVMDYNIEINLYTVPGQVKYNATRRLALQGCDGIVFVGDRMMLRRAHNFQSLKNLQENLGTSNRGIFNIPWVIQYNKRDLAKIGAQLLSYKQMEKDLNGKLRAPSFETSAVTGKNRRKKIK